MRFVYGSLEMELTTRHDYPYPNRKKIVQVKERSAAGIPHVESFGFVDNFREFNFSGMPTSEYQELLDWFISVVNGMELTFRVTDDLGETFDANFAEPEINFELTGYDQWSGSFTLEVKP